MWPAGLRSSRVTSARWPRPGLRAGPPRSRHERHAAGVPVQSQVRRPWTPPPGRVAGDTEVRAAVLHGQLVGRVVVAHVVVPTRVPASAPPGPCAGSRRGDRSRTRPDRWADGWSHAAMWCTPRGQAGAARSKHEPSACRIVAHHRRPGPRAGAAPRAPCARPGGREDAGHDHVVDRLAGAEPRCARPRRARRRSRSGRRPGARPRRTPRTPRALRPPPRPWVRVVEPAPSTAETLDSCEKRREHSSTSLHTGSLAPGRRRGADDFNARGRALGLSIALATEAQLPLGEQNLYGSAHRDGRQVGLGLPARGREGSSTGCC